MGRAVKRLNARFVETVSEAGRHADGDGLYLVVDESGNKRWLFRYRLNRKRRDMGLGGYPTISLVEARRRADEVRRLKLDGSDPVDVRRASRAVGNLPTFRQIAAEVIDDEQAKSSNAKVRYQWSHLLGPKYCDSLLDQPVNSITTSDVQKVLRPVWHDKPETARKLLRRLKRVFEQARGRLRDVHGIAMAENPARWEDLRALGFQAPKKLSQGRHPSLAYSEIPDFMASLRQRTNTAAMALEVLILTALRTKSLIDATWDEIDFSTNVWTVPIEHLKDKKHRTEPMRVPLAPRVRQLLETLAQIRESKFVFPGQKTGRSLTDMALLSCLHKMNRDGSGQTRWRDPIDGRSVVPHGFRATFRTWTEEQTNFPTAVAEQALGHQVGTEVERAYRRTDLLEVRRKLMMSWESYCGGLTTGTEAESPNGI